QRIVRHVEELQLEQRGQRGNRSAELVVRRLERFDARKIAKRRQCAGQLVSVEVEIGEELQRGEIRQRADQSVAVEPEQWNVTARTTHVVPGARIVGAFPAAVVRQLVAAGRVVQCDERIVLRLRHFRGGGAREGQR